MIKRLAATGVKVKAQYSGIEDEQKVAKRFIDSVFDGAALSLG